MMIFKKMLQKLFVRYSKVNKSKVNKSKVKESNNIGESIGLLINVEILRKHHKLQNKIPQTNKKLETMMASNIHDKIGRIK
jgi:hypothetical protein